MAVECEGPPFLKNTPCWLIPLHDKGSRNTWFGFGLDQVGFCTHMRNKAPTERVPPNHRFGDGASSQAFRAWSRFFFFFFFLALQCSWHFCVASLLVGAGKVEKPLAFPRSKDL